MKHHDEYRPAEYRRIDVQVKETQSVGFIRVPGERPRTTLSVVLRVGTRLRDVLRAAGR